MNWPYVRAVRLLLAAVLLQPLTWAVNCSGSSQSDAHQLLQTELLDKHGHQPVVVPSMSSPPIITITQNNSSQVSSSSSSSSASSMLALSSHTSNNHIYLNHPNFEHPPAGNETGNGLTGALMDTTEEPVMSVDEEVIQMLGPVRDPMTTVIPMTIVYSLILVTGLIGNVCTCTVIARNKYMHTTVNYYLFSLSISDLLLLVLGLPQELWSLWWRYPYVFGETFCILRAMVSEMCTNASVLTVLAFTIERYIAICHPLKAHAMTSLRRAIKTILCIWAIAALCSIPIALQLGVIIQTSNITKLELPITRQCAVKRPIRHAFEVASGLFFILPMTVISILYVLIGIQLRRSGPGSGATTGSNPSHNSSLTQPLNSGSSYHGHHSSTDNSPPNGRLRSDSCAATLATGHHLRSGSNKHFTAQQNRRAVIKMLVAVVVSFFICWSPFHAQRIMATNWHLLEDHDHSGRILMIYQILTYISGVTYYLTATINPLLYQLLSLKFRLAFKDTFGFWCPCLKAPEKHPEFSYSTVVINGVATTSSRGLHDEPLSKYNSSFRGSISAQQLNQLNVRDSPNAQRTSSNTGLVIKCDNNGNGNNTHLMVNPTMMSGGGSSGGTGGAAVGRSASCQDVFGGQVRRCLLTSSPSSSTIEAKP